MQTDFPEIYMQILDIYIKQFLSSNSQHSEHLDILTSTHPQYMPRGIEFTHTGVMLPFPPNHRERCQYKNIHSLKFTLVLPIPVCSLICNSRDGGNISQGSIHSSFHITVNGCHSLVFLQNSQQFLKKYSLMLIWEFCYMCVCVRAHRNVNSCMRYLPSPN